MNNRVLFYDSMRAAGVCLGTIQARTHVQLAIACQQALIHAQRRLRFTVQQVYGRRGTWVTNVLSMLLHTARLGSSLATTLPHDGFIITLTLICVSMNVATLVMFWSDYKPFGQMQFPFLMILVSVRFFSSGPPCVCAFLVTLSFGSSRFRSFLFCVFLLLSRVMDPLSSSTSTVPSIDANFEHDMRNPFFGITLLRAG